MEIQYVITVILVTSFVSSVVADDRTDMEIQKYDNIINDMYKSEKLIKVGNYENDIFGVINGVTNLFKLIGGIWSVIKTPVKGEKYIYTDKYTLNDWIDEQRSTHLAFIALKDVVSKCSQKDFDSFNDAINTSIARWKDAAELYRGFKNCCDTGEMIRCTEIGRNFPSQKSFNVMFDVEFERLILLKKRIQDDTVSYQLICSPDSPIKDIVTESSTQHDMSLYRREILRMGGMIGRKCVDYKVPGLWENIWGKVKSVFG